MRIAHNTKSIDTVTRAGEDPFIMGPTKTQQVDIIGRLVTGPTITGASLMFGLDKIPLH